MTASGNASARVCVVVVTWNGAPWIRRCLDSLRASSVPPQVVVVDNASEDDTAVIVARDYPEVELLRLAANAGFGVGNNVGIARAVELGMDAVFLLNQDAWVEETTLAQLGGFLASHPAYGVVSPLHCSPGPDSVDRKTLTWYLTPHAADYLSDACTGRTRPHYDIRGINAAAWLVRTEVFRRVGGFDPLFFMYGEDDDLIERLALHRVRFALLPSARVVHLRESPRPRRARPPTRFERIDRLAVRQRSQLIAELKRPGFSARFMVALLLARGIVQPFAAFLVDHAGEALAASWLAAWRLAFEIPRVRRHAALCATPGPHFLAHRPAGPATLAAPARPAPADIVSEPPGG